MEKKIRKNLCVGILRYPTGLHVRISRYLVFPLINDVVYIDGFSLRVILGGVFVLLFDSPQLQYQPQTNALKERKPVTRTVRFV